MRCPTCGTDVSDPVGCSACAERLVADGGTEADPVLDSFGATPAGIKFICLFTVPAVVAFAVVGLRLLVGAGLTDLVTTFLGGSLLLFAGLLLATIVGLWTMQAWGWILAMGTYAFATVLIASGLLTPSIGEIVTLALNLLFWWYVYGMQHLYVGDGLPRGAGGTSQQG